VEKIVIQQTQAIIQILIWSLM